MKYAPQTAYFVHEETGTVLRVTAAPPALLDMLPEVYREVGAAEYRRLRAAQDRAHRAEQRAFEREVSNHG